MVSLYQLTETYQRLESMAQDDGVSEELFNQMLDDMDWKTDFEEKCDSYVEIIRNLEVAAGADRGQIESIEKILETIKESLTSKENKIKRMKENLCKGMIATHNEKFRTKKYSFWTQKTTPAVVIDGVVPMEYLIAQEPKVDKKKLADDLKKAEKDGKKIDFAHLESHEIARFK